MVTILRCVFWICVITVCVIPGCKKSPTKPASKTQNTQFASSLPGIPSGYPMDFIPIYSGAEVFIARYGDPNLYIDMYSQDPVSQIVSYYTQYFSQIGWVPDHNRPISMGDAFLFSKDGDIIGLAYNTIDPDRGSRIIITWIIKDKDSISTPANRDY